jgi:hypothetical protein
VHLAEHGKLTLDSKRIKGNLEDFLQRENRFSSLTRKNPKASEELHHHLQVRRALQLPRLAVPVDRSLHFGVAFALPVSGQRGGIEPNAEPNVKVGWECACCVATVCCSAGSC